MATVASSVISVVGSLNLTCKSMFDRSQQNRKTIQLHDIDDRRVKEELVAPA